MKRLLCIILVLAAPAFGVATYQNFYTVWLDSLRLRNGPYWLTLVAPTLSADRLWVLPAITGTTGQFLQTDGAGTLTWATGGGGAAWGSITGTLSSQTDLQNALNAKAATATTVGGLRDHGCRARFAYEFDDDGTRRDRGEHRFAADGRSDSSCTQPGGFDDND